jgi:hypothetical protein
MHLVSCLLLLALLHQQCVFLVLGKMGHTEPSFLGESGAYRAIFYG